MIEPDFWRGRRVFLTGHTGFKGAWTALVLRSLGAEVTGFALAPEHPDGIFSAARVVEDIQHKIGDVRDPRALDEPVGETQPEIVLHMAAQSLVRASYLEPVATYATNVMGTVHLLETARHSASVRAIVVVTSDKCYENFGHAHAYREGEPLGGHDPYSNSKSCAELVTEAYRRSFFNNDSGGDGCTVAVASARAGNVIGGGDWAADRLVPDAMRAFCDRRTLEVRNPDAVRPWQHVLDPILAYLLLAERLVEHGQIYAEAWNFGPGPESEIPVAQIVDRLARGWGKGARWRHDGRDHPPEAAVLKLDCAKAAARLAWRPVLDIDRTIELTLDWYRAQRAGTDMRAFALRQIEDVMGAARSSFAPAEPASSPAAAG